MSSYGASHTRTAIKKEKKKEKLQTIWATTILACATGLCAASTRRPAQARATSSSARSPTHTHARVRSERKGLTCFPPAACYARGEHTVGRLICESCHHCVPHRLSLSGVHRPAISTAFAAAGLIRHPSQNTAAHLIDLGCWLTSGHPHTESPVAKI